MFLTYFGIKKSLFILLLVVLAHLLIIHWQEDDPIDVKFNRDANSAIRRAKTTACKDELTQFVSRTGQIKPYQFIERRCNQDQKQKLLQRVGCSNLNTLNEIGTELVRIEEDVDDLKDCLDICFSYGYSHGGYYKSTKSNQCFCSDLSNLNSFESAGACDRLDEVAWFRVNEGIFYPTSTECLPLVHPSRVTTKIAFILTLRGRSILQIKRLLDNIYSSRHIYYLHIDTQDEFLFEHSLNLELKYNNIIVARSRFETIWGGPKLLSAIVDALENLSGHDWDYVINLSESDFPINPVEKLESYLKDKDCIFLRSHNLKGYNFIKKQGLDRNFYQCERRVWRLGRRRLPRGIIFSGGSDWFALPRSFSDYITRNKNNPTSLVAPLLQLYNHTLLPGESFFHTVALNSEFCDKYVDNNLRVTNWKQKQGCKCQHRNVVDWCGCSPLVYRVSDLSKLASLRNSSELFFSRKFDPTISQSVINEVERTFLHRNRVAIPLNRYWLDIYAKDVPKRSRQPDESIYRQLSQLVKGQIGLPNLEVQTIDRYFENDSYKGMVFELCSKEKSCQQLLLVDNTQFRVSHEASEYRCPNIRPYRLIKLQVGHDFDPNERIFRDHRPLNSRSDLSVYHEWLYDSNSSKSNISELTLQFQWTNSENEMFVQDVKLKSGSERAQLSFAHRLNARRPLKSGLWNLKISHNNATCNEHKFLLFNCGSNPKAALSQVDFDQIFTVNDTCYIGDTAGLASCLNTKWTTLHKQLIEGSFFKHQI